MPAVDAEVKSTLKFNGYYISLMHFEKNMKFKRQPVSIEFDVDSEFEIIGEDRATVTLFLSIFDEAETNNYPFSIKLAVTGEYQVDNLDAEKNKALFEVNAVAILFPYVRALVTTITANANVQPLILPPINVVNLLRQKIAQKSKK